MHIRLYEPLPEPVMMATVSFSLPEALPAAVGAATIELDSVACR
jgi:hypothetical protein